MTIEKFVRFDQHGAYDCGFDGWTFAVAIGLDGVLRGKQFLIDSTALTRDEREPALLEGPNWP